AICYRPFGAFERGNALFPGPCGGIATRPPTGPPCRPRPRPTPPPGAWKCFFSFTRGRRFALAPGYMLWPPPGASRTWMDAWMPLAVKSSPGGVGATRVLTGILTPHLVSRFSQLPTGVSLSSVLLAFGFAAAIGIFFGDYPARKASRLDPIDALRYSRLGGRVRAQF